MSRTDKDLPYNVREARGEVGPYSPDNGRSYRGNWGSGDSGFRWARRWMKRHRSKQLRRFRGSKPNQKRTWDFE